MSVSFFFFLKKKNIFVQFVFLAFFFTTVRRILHNQVIIRTKKAGFSVHSYKMSNLLNFMKRDEQN